MKDNGLNILNFGFDSFYIGYYISKIDEDLLYQLEQMKLEAKELDFKEDSVQVKLSNFQFSVKPSGTKTGYTYVLENKELFSIMISDKESDFSKYNEVGYPFPNVYVQIRSKLLWGAGFKKSFEIVKEVLENITDGEVIKYLISRIDIALDFQGIEFTSDDLENFITRARSQSMYFTKDKKKLKSSVKNRLQKMKEQGLSEEERMMELLKNIDEEKSAYFSKKLTGFKFGKSQISARLYNKKEELRKSKKDWFELIWEDYQGYKEDNDVWRIEFQLRSRILGEFDVKENIYDLLNGLNSIWEYCTEWLEYRLDDNERVSRRTVAGFWKKIQNLDFNNDSDYLISGKKKLKRKKIYSSDSELLTSMIKGCISSIGAINNYDKKEIKRYMANVINGFDDYIKEKFSKSVRYADIPT